MNGSTAVSKWPDYATKFATAGPDQAVCWWQVVFSESGISWVTNWTGRRRKHE